MQAEAVEHLFQSVLPYDIIVEEARKLGVVKRARKLDPALLVMSLVMMGGSSEAGRLAAAIRDYRDRGGPQVARSASYRWFDEEFLALMEVLVGRAKAYLAEMPLHLPGVLAGRKDWRAVDSTVVKLPKELRASFEGTGDYAALKVHDEVSLGLENVVDWHITPAKRHDGPELVVDEGRRGTGLLIDLGYVSHKLFRDCEEHDVHVVARLKNGWKVWLDDDVRFQQAQRWEVPDEFMDKLGVEKLPDELAFPLDVDVRLGDLKQGVRARLVNIETPAGWRAYLTNVPRDTHDAEAIAFLYSLRWSVEIQHKLAKSGCKLGAIQAEKPVGAKILVHAAFLASLLANALAHLEHLDQGYVGEKCVRPTGQRPPVHAMLMWKMLQCSAPGIAQLLGGQNAGGRGWEHYADVLRHAGRDANWRSKPSPIDDAKGRNPAGRPMRRHRKKTAKEKAAGKVR